MTKPTLTQTVLIRMTPEQRSIYTTLGGAKWLRALLETFSKQEGKK